LQEAFKLRLGRMTSMLSGTSTHVEQQSMQSISEKMLKKQKTLTLDKNPTPQKLLVTC